jgi:hypothetical protein
MVCSFDIDGRIKENCEHDDLRKANLGLMVIGTFFVAISGSKMYCNATCVCSSTVSLSVEVYAVFIFLLSIVLVSLSSIINTKFKLCNREDKGETKSPDTVLGISVSLLILSFGYLSFVFYENYRGSISFNKMSRA